MTNERRYDLDWLRVFAFVLLILYHIGMFYVPWSWHVKSGHAPVDAFRIPMLLMNSWRLPLLFFVSGVAVRYALDKTRQGSFIRNRSYRLFVPLLFGMWIVCAPQAYYELRQAGTISANLFEFYRGYASMPWDSPDWGIITPTWNHLWYLLYVLVYTLVIGLLSLLTSRRFEKNLDSLTKWALQHPVVSLGVAVPSTVLFARFLMSDSVGAQQTLWGDWHNLTVSFLVMLFGYSVAKHEAFWTAMKQARWLMLTMALVASALVVINALHNSTSIAILRVVHCWLVIYTLMGFGQTILNKNSTALSYLTAAVFPYYVLHQSIIIVAGIYLSKASFSLPVEFFLLLTITFVSCALIYHCIIRNTGRWGVLFGANNRK